MDIGGGLGIVVGQGGDHETFRDDTDGVGIMAAALPAARADNTPCTGSLQGVINGNVVVPDGATCQLNNATVTGNVFVSTGASLAMGVLVQ